MGKAHRRGMGNYRTDFKKGVAWRACPERS